ncbi:glycosyltransferase, partial [Morganella morganii]|uniref:glycosyltransferase n=1 Tax=Morganella morganii TaxID=582 RepID=UPI0021D11CA9
LKRIKYNLLSILLRKRIDNIFAMGELGVEWFKKNHFKENKIHQFQYFIECNEKKECEFPIKNNDVINFIYIGQFIDRKNVISTLNSFISLRNIENWNLDLYGSGPLHHHMNNIIKDNKIDGKINIHDNISNENLITKILPNYDYLILPSKFDGWGVVVNEALSQGVKVITNKNCGSSTLVEKSKNFGFVYETSLTDCISNI